MIKHATNDALWDYVTGITAVEGTPEARSNPLRLDEQPDGQGGQARTVVDSRTRNTEVVELTPASYRAAAERHAHRLRAEPSTMLNPPISALLTALVVGRARMTEEWVNRIFRRIAPVDALGQPLHKGRQFYYRRWGDEHLAIVDTLLAERAPYKTMRNLPTSHFDELELHGFAVPMSDEEAQRAFRDINFVEQRFGLLMRILSNNHQWQAVQLLLDPTVGVTYGDVVTLGAGSRWTDAGTDPIADMQTMVGKITLATGQSNMSVDIKMSEQAYRAMVTNQSFRDQISAQHLGIAFQFTPSGDDVGGLAAQMGILAKAAGLVECRQIEVIRPHGLAPGAAAPGPLLSPMVFAHLVEPLVGSDLDTEYGAETWAVHFALNDGVPQPEFRVDMTRQTVRPATREKKLSIVSPSAAAATFGVAA